MSIIRFKLTKYKFAKLTKYNFATINYEVSTGHTKGYNAANIKQAAELTHTYKWTEYGL